MAFPLPRRRSLAIAIFAIVLLASSYVMVAESTTVVVLNNSLVATSASQTSVLGHQGVSVTYNNTLGQVVNATLFASFQNSGGNTVYISFFVSSFQPGKAQSFFFGPNLASGNYTARIFAINQEGIPLSVTSSVKVTL